MQWFDRFSIKSRLVASFALLLVLLGTVVALGWVNSANSQSAVHRIVNEDMVKFEIVAEINSLAGTNARNTLQLFIVDPQERPAIRERMTQTRQTLDKLFEKLGPMIYAPEGKALFEDMKSKRQTYAAAFAKASDTLNTDPELAEQQLRNEVLPAINALGEPIAKLKEFQLTLANKSAATLVQSLRTQTVIGLTIGIAATLIVVVVAIALVRSIMRPLQHAMEVAATVGHGDLTMQVHATGNHELTRLLESLRDMQGQLSSSLANIQDSTVQVASASSQIAAANLDLSARTESQASSLEETAASMEQMTASVQQNQKVTQTANELSTTASREAHTVGQRVQEVVAMIADLHSSSARIRDIIGVIDSIAFQTNILALNAAVEAARAGEQGRGFAVVASEVRALAQRSAQAAQEIKTIIQDNTTKMEAGSELAAKAGEAVKLVVSSIERVNVTVSEVAVSTREQSEGINQIGQAVVQLDEATQQNAALVEETSAATTNLDEQVQSLKQQIGRFRMAATRSVASFVDTQQAKLSAPTRVHIKQLT